MGRGIARITALIVLWSSLVFGQGQALDRAVLELVVNSTARGEVFVLLRQNDILVPIETLRDAGLVRLRAPTEEHDGVAHVSLHAAGLPFDYDERALTLTITAPPAVLSRATVDLSAPPTQDLRYDSNPSAFLNYAPRLSDGRHFQAFAEAGFSAGSFLAESSATYTPERGPTRLVTRATYDDRAHLRTATLGDTFVSAGALGGAVSLGGLALTRNYGLDPSLVKIPRLGYTGSALSPSTVDVYVNDVLVRRAPLDAGEFQLTNITPLAGAGTTRYVLRDAYGQEQRLESSYYSSSSVLAVGLSEFAYGIGLVREGFGTRSFGYGAPAVIGWHRFGLSEHVTPGFHLEFDGALANLGSEVTVAGEFGEVELHAAGSLGTAADAPRGAAGLVGYTYRGAAASLRSVLRANSRHYTTLSLASEQYRTLLEHVTTTSHPLGSTASLNTDIALALSHDRAPLARFSVSINARLSRELSLHVQTSRSQLELGRWEHSLFSTLNWILPWSHSAQLSEHVGPEGTNVTAQLSRALPPEPAGLGYQVSGSTGATTRASASVQGQAPFGRLGATYTNTAGDQATLLEASGGIVLIGGKPYFTRPLSRSFALLRVPGAPNVRGYLNNREMGTTDSSGDLFVPDLVPYQVNRLRIDQADLPLDFQFERDEFLLAPPTRGGAIVEFSVRQVRISRGRITSGPGRRPPPVRFGTVTVETPSGPVTSLLGNNGEFELDGLTEGRWTGTVEWAEGQCKVPIQIPATQAIVQHLGTLRCISSGEQRPRP